MTLGIRSRLAFVVTALFACTATVGSVFLLRFVHDRLVDDATSNAERLLETYLSDMAQGTAVIAGTDSSSATTFFYLDADGKEVSQQAYVDALLAVVPVGFPSVVQQGEPPSVAIGQADGTIAGSTSAGVATAGGSPAGVADGSTMMITVVASREGSIAPVARGQGVTAVAQKIRLADGSVFSVGTSSPLAPIDDSIATLQAVLWVAVPLLAAVAGGLTHLSVGRALRPVRNITRRTQAISDRNLDERVPEPATRDDISELARTMNGMLDRLEAARHRQRRFVADASHELRSPIAASQAQLEVAMAHPGAADWRDTAANVLLEQHQLGELVDGLLALSRLDEQGIGATAPTDVRDLVEREASRHREHTVTVGGVRSAIVEASAPHLVRALRNLIDNADQHADTTVGVTVGETTEGFVRIDVDDDGPGVEPAARELVFDRFSRLDEERTRGHNGAGLGLAIAREIANAHGGSVRCTDSPTGGARFTITLPGARDVSDPAHAQTDTSAPATHVGAGASSAPL